MSRLALYGAGGHGKVVADAALESGKWDEIVFFDEACNTIENGHWDIRGDYSSLLSSIDEFQGVNVSIGENIARQQYFLRLEKIGAPLVSIVHPSAVISRFASIGIGSVIFANSVVNIDSVVGKGGIINTGSTVDHECEIGEFVHISPGVNLAGNTSVGDCSVVGVGACTKQGVAIGKSSIVGAGAVVLHNVPSDTVIVGNPAKRFL